MKAQNDNPFQVERKKEILIMGGGIVLFSTGCYLISHMPSPDPLELDRNRIFRLDRFAVDFSCEETALFSDITAGLCIGLPIVSLLTSQSRKAIFQDIVMYVESFSYIQGLTFLSKSIFRRPRPYAYHLSENSDINDSAIRSFFSGHTALAFNGVVFASTVFQRRNPHSQYVKSIWIAGMIGAAATAIFRVTSGNHFPTDVFVGACVGSFTGWIVPYCHRANDPNKKLSIMVGNPAGVRYHF